MRHIMVDLETLDDRNTAVILSIGAVKFSLENFTLGDDFYRVIDSQSCQEAGLTIGQSTVEWWLQPNHQEAWQDLVRADSVRHPLHSVLIHFANWSLSDHDPDLFIWGNGSNFDNTILHNAYRACNLQYPGSPRDDPEYRKNDLCYRTIRKMFGIKTYKYPGKHNALADARVQAQSLVDFFKEERERI